MGCLSSFGMPNFPPAVLYNKEIRALVKSKDELLGKLYFQKIAKNGTEELLKIIEENKKLAPLLKPKIDQLMKKMNFSEPQVIATGNVCKNPCYEYNSRIVNMCPKCGGFVKDEPENGYTIETEYNRNSGRYEEYKAYNDVVCNKFTYNDKIDKCDYDIDELCKYFEKVDKTKKFIYKIYEEDKNGQETLKDYEVYQKYMIIDGERFNFPYGINLRCFLRLNDELYFTRDHMSNDDFDDHIGTYNTYFFHKDNADYIDLGQALGYYGYKFKHFVCIFTCLKCSFKYHIIRTSPFRFRDKSKDNVQK